MDFAVFRPNALPPGPDPGTPAARTIGCPNCGLIEGGVARRAHEVVTCRRCHSPLARGADPGLDAALAWAATATLLLVPAMLAPLLTTSAIGATRTSILPSGAFMMWREGWPVLACVVLLFTMVFPALRFGLLTTVLGSLRLGARPAWLAAAFRLADALETWAMLDVFLVAGVVAYLRLQDSLFVTLGTGGWCFAAAALASLFTRATLDRPSIWNRIAPPCVGPPPAHACSCRRCDLVQPAARPGTRCRRCGAVLQSSGRSATMRSIALLLAAALLYFPANFYPMATIPMNLTPTSYSVLGGIVDLFEANYVGLALLVFCASFAIPLLKMVGMSWCTVSALRRSTTRLVAKTRVYRWLEEIGRWSMVDPFTIACTIPVVHYNSLIDGRTGAAATPFAAVVILTTLAVKSFDPRRLWLGEARPG